MRILSPSYCKFQDFFLMKAITLVKHWRYCLNLTLKFNLYFLQRQPKLHFVYKSIPDNKISDMFNPFPNKPWFLHVCITSFLKGLLDKVDLLVRNNFSFSHNVFYPFGELSAIFVKIEIVVGKLFQCGSLKFVLWDVIWPKKGFPILDLKFEKEESIFSIEKNAF